jgi:hypothetical protein
MDEPVEVISDCQEKLEAILSKKGVESWPSHPWRLDSLVGVLRLFSQSICESRSKYYLCGSFNCPCSSGHPSSEWPSGSEPKEETE